MRPIFAIILACFAVAPATASAQAPGVVTGPAQPIGTTTATITGTVDPNGSPATYHFDYGTTTAYGLRTADQSAGDGDGDVAVQATLASLTANTTYHYRLVADGEEGLDRTFKTAAAPANPKPPAIARLSATDKTATSARLTARVTPNRAATAWHVEWGTSTSFGNQTPDQTLQPGSGGGVVVSTALDGLPSYTKIYWRVVATNAAGVKRSGTASFTTLRALTGVSLSLFPDATDWGGTVSISGRVDGAGVNGLTVALEQNSFPFDVGFHEVATARTGRTGEFRFSARPVFIATRYRAVTRTTLPATSPEISALARVRASLHRARKTRRFVRLAGTANPGVPNGRARLQRRTRRGGWALVRAKQVSTPSSNASAYRFKVRRLRRPAVYRVAVAARDGGAHLDGVSRGVLVGKRRHR